MARTICAKVGTYFLTYSTFNLKCKCLINVPASGELIFAHRRMSLPWMEVIVDFYEKEEKILHHIGDMREGGPTIYCQFVWLLPRFVLSFERS